MSVVLLLGASLVPLALSRSNQPPRSIVRPRPRRRRIRPRRSSTDIVTVNNSGELTQANAQAALAAARAAGATATIGRSASVGMTACPAAGSPVQVPPSGFAYPMGTTVSAARVRRTGHGALDLRPAHADRVVMGKLSADLRGAAAGDTITLIASSGAPTPFTIAAVVDDAIARRDRNVDVARRLQTGWGSSS